MMANEAERAALQKALRGTTAALAALPEGSPYTHSLSVFRLAILEALGEPEAGRRLPPSASPR
jgi:hypothetical protein